MRRNAGRRNWRDKAVYTCTPSSSACWLDLTGPIKIRRGKIAAPGTAEGLNHHTEFARRSSPGGGRPCRPGYSDGRGGLE